jgi:predicted transcriptional regulator
MQYRSQDVIVSNILQVARDGCNRTQIMYGAYLSHTQLTKYLDMLTASGLLESRDVNNLRTSAKGFRYLQMQRQLQAIIHARAGAASVVSVVDSRA